MNGSRNFLLVSILYFANPPTLLIVYLVFWFQKYLAFINPVFCKPTYPLNSVLGSLFFLASFSVILFVFMYPKKMNNEKNKKRSEKLRLS